jgi:hypothetical protein
MDFTYLTQPPRSYTFEMPKLKFWIESQCIGKVLNLFGGKVRLNVDEISNDIDINMKTDYHMDVIEFVDSWKGKPFDTIVLDPLYNWRKAKEKYEGRMIGQYPQLKNKLLSIITKDAIVISLGYDTVGMSKSRGFEKIGICVICHGGDHHDTLCVVEKRILVSKPKSLFEF